MNSKKKLKQVKKLPNESFPLDREKKVTRNFNRYETVQMVDASTIES